MLDISLLYIGAVVLILVIGFVFAFKMGAAAALDADRQWQLPELDTEPAATPAAQPAASLGAAHVQAHVQQPA